MRINTKTGKIELVKREQRSLQEASDVLAHVAKHGDGDMARAASKAIQAINDVREVLYFTNVDQAEAAQV